MAVPRKNFQVRFILDAIFIEYKDKQSLKRTTVIKLGDKLLEKDALNIESLDWTLSKRKDKFTILSTILNDRSNLQETFTTRDICMRWVYDISHRDHEKFLQKETEFVLERLCDANAAHGVSEHWCSENGYKTEDSSDVLDNICKAIRKSHKTYVTTSIKDELLKRGNELDKFEHGEWISAVIDSPEAITWNPLLFDLCATKFDTVIPIIANMALPKIDMASPKSKEVPVICECRLYPKTHNQKVASTSTTTFIRKNLETYVGAVQGPAILDVPQRIDALNGMLDTMEKKKYVDRSDVKKMRKHHRILKAEYTKVMAENEAIHDDLQKSKIENRRLVKDNKELSLQVKSKPQVHVDAVAALENEVEESKRHNEKLTTENETQRERLNICEEKIKKQDEKIAQQNEMQNKRFEGLERQITYLLRGAHSLGGSRSTGLVDVESTSKGYAKSVPHE